MIEADESDDFHDFRFEIKTSTLSSLKINSIRDIEAQILAEYVNGISRPFKLTLGGTLFQPCFRWLQKLYRLL